MIKKFEEFINESTGASLSMRTDDRFNSDKRMIKKSIRKFIKPQIIKKLTPKVKEFCDILNKVGFSVYINVEDYGKNGVRQNALNFDKEDESPYLSKYTDTHEPRYRIDDICLSIVNNPGMYLHLKPTKKSLIEKNSHLHNFFYTDEDHNEFLKIMINNQEMSTLQSHWHIFHFDDEISNKYANSEMLVYKENLYFDLTLPRFDCDLMDELIDNDQDLYRAILDEGVCSGELVLKVLNYYCDYFDTVNANLRKKIG